MTQTKSYCSIKITALAFCSMLFTSALAQSLELENPLRFLALGDSYTIGQSVTTNQRWPAQLRDSLVTRGINTDDLRYIATTGWRTDNLINATKNQDLGNQNYNLVSLLIGVNNQYQNRPFTQYVAEFPALLDSAIRYAGNDPSHVFIVSIPDYAFTPFGQQSGNPNQISAELDQYNGYSRQIADSLGITYFDITPISRLGLQHPEYVASDGLHPSGIQYTEWVKTHAGIY
jgi:lysophospholipase L1-like esterase